MGIFPSLKKLGGTKSGTELQKNIHYYWHQFWGTTHKDKFISNEIIQKWNPNKQIEAQIVLRILDLVPQPFTRMQMVEANVEPIPKMRHKLCRPFWLWVPPRKRSYVGHSISCGTNFKKCSTWGKPVSTINTVRKSEEASRWDLWKFRPSTAYASFPRILVFKHEFLANE